MSNVILLDPEGQAFRNASNKLETLQNQLFKTENDIILLEHIRKTLEENISVLKNRQIIPMLVEYRKAREDLNKVCNNLNMHKITRNNLEHSIEQARKYFIECREKYLISIEIKRCKIIDIRSKNGR